MAEVQTMTESGEMTQRFIEFVMMQAQNTAHFLGQIPGPDGQATVNLDLAQMFIDQLVMIRAKTKGNLSHDELAVLNNAVSNLQMTFFEVSQKGGAASPAAIEEPPVAAAPAPTPEPAAPAATSEPEPSADSRKKFTKSYGA